MKDKLVKYTLIFEDGTKEYTKALKSQFDDIKLLYTNELVRTESGLKLCVQVIK